MAARFSRAVSLVALAVPLFSLPAAFCRQSPATTDLDGQVETFLETHRDKWRDTNVPASDGKLLYDLVLQHGFRNALEIGTSTGHSAIWIAWALSKTGGKLTTIEIDKARHDEALEHFKQAGLSAYVDARLGDAHELVHELKGPFDFVFVDADKEWSKKYFVAISPKLAPGGCYTMHNARMRRGEIREFLEHVRTLPDYDTTVDTSSEAGVSISCKKSAN